MAEFVYNGVGLTVERDPDGEYEVALTQRGRWASLCRALGGGRTPELYVPYAEAEPLRALLRESLGAYVGDPREDAAAFACCDCLCSVLGVVRFDWDDPDLMVAYYGAYARGYWGAVWEALTHGRLTYNLCLQGREVREVFAPVFREAP